MSESVKLIVDAFVSLKDRVAMENLREHRQLLRKKLQDIDCIDVSASLQLIESDLSEIEAGLVRLQYTADSKRNRNTARPKSPGKPRKKGPVIRDGRQV